jgi:hypothetical protein
LFLRSLLKLSVPRGYKIQGTKSEMSMALGMTYLIVGTGRFRSGRRHGTAKDIQ